MAAELQFRLTGGASNAVPADSLGGVGSSEQLSAIALNNLFDNVEPAEAVAGDTEYRAIDIYNNGDEVATSVEFYFDAQTSSADTDLAAGLDSGTQSIADEDIAPATPAITFTAPTEGSALSVSDIAVGGRQRVWIRRTVGAAAGNTSSDQATLAVKYA